MSNKKYADLLSYLYLLVCFLTPDEQLILVLIMSYVSLNMY